MDTFMDKLAQKLNAQEMIRANTAADAEEMSKLKNQVKEYNECLEKLSKLLADGEQKLAGAQMNGEELKRLVQESIAKIQVLQQTMQQNADDIDEIDMALEEWKTSLTAVLAEQKESLDSALEAQQNAVNAALEAQQTNLDTKLNDCNENVHKECVKVYRNVQAVVVEENNKQSENIMTSVNALKGKLNAILGVSIVALVASLCSAVVAILNLLNFKLF